MNPRWFGSVATLIASASLATAQAPMPATSSPPSSPSASVPLLANGLPATSSPPSSPSASVPLLANGQPAPAEMVSRQAAKTADVKPAAASSDAPAATPAPAAPPPATFPPVQPIDANSVHHDGPSVFATPSGDGPPYRNIWGRAEYLLWKIKETPLPAILGQIPNADAKLMELPVNDITPTFGGRNLSYGEQNGVQLQLGVALDSCGVWAVTGGFFQLEHAARGASFSTDATGRPAIGPVFFDPVIDRQTIILYGDPNNRTGSIEALDQSRLYGFEINLQRRVTAIFSDRLDLFVGYRHIGFDESLSAAGTTTQIAATPSPAAVVAYTDNFGVHNNFDGAQIGFETEFDYSCLFLDVCGKFGIGNEHETYGINGATAFISTDPTMPSRTFAGGTLAQPANIGHFDRNRFSFLGEISIAGGVRLCDNHVKPFIGYDFLGLSKVLRIDNIIDNVDATGVPSLQGPMRNLAAAFPQPKVDDGRFWAQGLTVGVSLEY